jgi:xylan 1,4-beta-xylosidase
VTDEGVARRAREDWTERIGRASGETDHKAAILPAPAGLSALAGRAQVSLSWLPVPGACGYLVHRAERPDGPFEPVDHKGQDVLAVPHPPYCDTTGESGRPYWYAVAACADVDTQGELSDPVPATASADGEAGVVTVDVDAATRTGTLHRPWRPMIGSEHLSHLFCADTTGGRPIGEELAAALVAARKAFGARSVRAHGILCDDLGVYREVDGTPVHDFTGIDRVYDRVLELGLKPVVELSFMPRDLASDPDKTVFSYGAIVSPPKDWERWGDLIRELVAHLVDRYGLAEVRDHWSFEVWNEANLEVFWSGTPEEFWRLYDVTANAVKAVDPGLVVGGPSSAAAGWVEELLTHLDGSNVALDFVSTHTYGSPPLDVRPQLRRHGRGEAAVWWTEWGVSPRHFNPVNDGVFSAVFLAKGMRSAAGRIDALSYWVASDHFEELGRPPSLLHGGFGLRTVGDLAKPRFWALAMLDRLGKRQLAVTEAGDGAGSLVESWAGADEDGRVAVLLWNGTLDQSKMDGCAALDRTVRLTVTGLSSGDYTVRHHRVDADHSNVVSTWREIGGVDWPDEDGWARLRAADRLEALHEDRTVTPEHGALTLEFTLPMPSLSLIELLPAETDG